MLAGLARCVGGCARFIAHGQELLSPCSHVCVVHALYASSQGEEGSRVRVWDYAPVHMSPLTRRDLPSRQHKSAGDAYLQHRSFGAAKKQCVRAWWGSAFELRVADLVHYV